MRNGNSFPWNPAPYLSLVFTLPMRNGNYTVGLASIMSFIRFYLTYEEWKLVSSVRETLNTWVFTLPMRNGNSKNFILSSSFFWFLPYLWGMETWTCCACACCASLGFYLTYEEWKHWKIRIYRSHRGRFYLTYEEWKQDIHGRSMGWHKVFTLPMRNGNTIIVEWKLCCFFVFTLPMRNGNQET